VSRRFAKRLERRAWARGKDAPRVAIELTNAIQIDHGLEVCADADKVRGPTDGFTEVTGSGAAPHVAKSAERVRGLTLDARRLGTEV
jgi:hypothetical protein